MDHDLGAYVRVMLFLFFVVVASALFSLTLQLITTLSAIAEGACA